MHACISAQIHEVFIDSCANTNIHTCIHTESAPGTRDVCMALFKCITDDDKEVRLEVAVALVCMYVCMYVYVCVCILWMHVCV